MQQFYSKKQVLITGATGFIGFVLLRTLLDKLPDTGRIYCLYRKQPGASHPKVVWINADVTRPAWGLDRDTMQKLARDVHVIFHLAAYTRWDVGLSAQVAANTLPVLEGAALASQFSKLHAYVVTSSYWAALHLRTSRIAETVFQDYSAGQELSAVLAGDDARLHEWPNAYSYAKNLAERLLHERYPGLPILLARVTSACGAWAFPARGFCCFDNALPALLKAIARGVRVFPDSARTAVNDSIPADLCANLLLANAAVHPPNGFSVIHCSSATRNMPPLGDKRLATLNRMLLEAYRFAFDDATVFLDHHARRPLTWIDDETRTRFPMDVETIEWPMLIDAMLAQLPFNSTERTYRCTDPAGAL
ncbi:SDR family oxidoreductase [Mycetohabitans rhizoxinica]|uniref:SDR family oxidoreductase n=1 Tax=Mycetohabitans rhizoxinica TaxID=412963 RepID=UPI0030D0A1D6